MQQRSPLPLRRRLVTGLAVVAAVAGLTPAFIAPDLASAAVPDAPLIDTASTEWTYSDNDTDPAAGNPDRLAWTTDDFDDSAFKTGTAPFGAKNGAPTGLGSAFPVTTLLNQYVGSTKVDVRTFHFRTSVDLTEDELSAISELQAKVTYDDAIQVFVNGEKVAGFVDDRVNAAPESERNLMYAGDSGGDPATSTFSIPAEALHAGSNTVAVALYQDRATSSDIYFDFASLTAVDVAAPNLPSDIVQTIGGDATSRNLTWYTDRDTAQSVQVAAMPSAAAATEAARSGAAFPATDAQTIAATSDGTTSSGQVNHRATITGLTERSGYIYRVGSEESGWSATYPLTTAAFSGDTSFLFFGDPQVGASGNLASDEAGWNDTVDVALSTYPETELLFSAGDQVNTASNEDQYATFLSPDALREYPLVPVNGNHDVGSKAYEQHFTVPNFDPTAGPASNANSSGGDYWFEYKDVLYVILNTNSSDTASHIEFMNRVVAEHGADAKWKVLGFHHSIYSVASHVFDTQIKNLRTALPETISDLGFDLVLQGHDHSYTRSYLVNDGALANAEEVPGQSVVTAKDGDVLYVTANSASGSKYYDVKDPEAWYASVINQEQVRNYSNVSISDDEITVTTLRSEQHGADAVNSVVDTVTLRHEGRPAAPAPQLTLGNTSVQQGGTLSVTGAGFEPNEALTAEVHSEPIALDPFSADAAGAIDLQWQIPADFEAGDHELVITRADGTPVTIAFVVAAAEAAADAGAAGASGAADGGATAGGTADGSAAAAGGTSAADGTAGSTGSSGSAGSAITAEAAANGSAGSPVAAGTDPAAGSGLAVTGANGQLLTFAIAGTLLALGGIVVAGTVLARRRARAGE
ncbi:purple acid phosphatase family protein [Leucobacter japonicus]|uniref:purple acid phosphatase family protein n=1 Tax=Leucobacter japonicus TaxID=1461259 RepID=UPI0006A7DE19|nr:metallophosphoesterase family protein [Leucobacter japonicus]